MDEAAKPVNARDLIQWDWGQCPVRMRMGWELADTLMWPGLVVVVEETRAG